MTGKAKANVRDVLAKYLKTNLADRSQTLPDSTGVVSDFTGKIQRNRESFSETNYNKYKVKKHYSALVEENRQRALQKLQKYLEEHVISNNEMETLKGKHAEDKKKKDSTKSFFHLASFEPRNTNEKFSRLIEGQKRLDEMTRDKILKLEVENQELREKFINTQRLDEMTMGKILKLEEELKAKWMLEIENQELREKLKVMKRLGDDAVGQVEELKLELEEKVQELKDIEQMNTSLTVKERECNGEMQEARKELLEGMKDRLGGRNNIGIKRMGEIDEKAFANTCKLKFPPGEVALQTTTLCSLWQENIKNSQWYPFKRQDVNGKTVEIVDENDEKLKNLLAEWGDEVYNAVATALLELNEYNGSGRYSIPEFWNFKENRKSTLKEVINYIINQNKTLKRKRR